MTELPADHPVRALPSRVARIRFQKVGKLYHFDCDGFEALQSGDYVIVETMRGTQMGQVVDFGVPDGSLDDYKPILRIATPAELLIRQEWEQRGVAALIDCRDIATRVGNYEECKFLAAQFNFDGSQLTVLYTAPDSKVNIQLLRHHLSQHFRHTRVELRQVGPRDVAKLIGGFGACGIPRCCSTFLTEFSPISIKMAKAQGISLNPSEITGMCGRLRCCLVYEYEQYVEARKHLPKRNKRVMTPHGEGKVLDIHPLQDAVTVLVEEAYHLVKREDLTPLDELEALERKAKAGCSKNESGGCDCGAQHAHRADKGDAADSQDDEADDLGDFDAEY
jgi:cell fate regulator YaaT (PSP1 superfamily)